MKEDLYNTCLAIAIKAHLGQFRHDGKTPYIKHPIEVAGMFDDWIFKAKAILHDAIEDGGDNGVDKHYILSELHKADKDSLFGAEIIDIVWAVVMLSRKKDEHYLDYVKGLWVHSLERFKIADITCNLADSPSDSQKRKYKKAMKILLTP